MKLSFTDICLMQKIMALLILAGCMSVFPLRAQQKHQGGRDTTTKKMLLPVYTSALGNVLSNTLAVSAMKSLLDSSLHARDKQGGWHPVVAFQFGYRTHNTFLNDTTGKAESAASYFGFQFYSGRLDSIWRKRVGEQLKPGDELFFDQIIAKDGKGLQYLSSPLHFIVK